MKIERLRNKKSKLIFLCGCLMVVVLLITLVFKGSKAKYRSSQIIPLINTKVKNNVPSFTTMGIYLEDSTGTETKNGKKYKKQETIPSEGFIINETNSYCEKFNSATNTNIKNDNAKLYTNIMGKHSMEGINKGDKCYIYFDKGSNKFISAKAFLLNMWGYEDISAISERTDFSVPKSDAGNVVKKAEDNDGTSYYLIGQPENNWVKFAGYYWRIVRINGDGTLRLIYQGEKPVILSASAVISSITWNGDFNSAEYVGYFYKLGEQRGLEKSSSIYGVVNNFYNNKLASVDIDKYIDKNAGFCNDRTTISGNGTGTNDTNFMTRKRIIDDRPNVQPVLTCSDNNDLFTYTGATKGNKKLANPIGLITADEVLMGGYGIVDYTTNNNNMYYIGKSYWTMSPSYFVVGKTHMLLVYAGNGVLAANGVDNSSGVRPVINLVKDVTFSQGNGSISSPFEI